MTASVNFRSSWELEIDVLQLEEARSRGFPDGLRLTARVDKKSLFSHDLKWVCWESGMEYLKGSVSFFPPTPQGQHSWHPLLTISQQTH